MATGYTRQSAADIVPSAQVKAAPVNAEFNQIQSFASETSGHRHDGSTGQGSWVPIVSDLDNDTYIAVELTTDEDLIRGVVANSPAFNISATAIVPASGATFGVGTTSDPMDIGIFDVFRVGTLTITTAATVSTGGTLTVNGSFVISTAGSFVVATPVTSSDPVNKEYVDTILASTTAAAASAAAAAASESAAAASAASAAASSTAAAISAAAAAAAVGGVKVSSVDTTPGTLDSKLVAGTHTSFVIGSTGANETYTINMSISGTADGALDMNGNLLTVDEILFNEGSEVKQQETSEPTAVSGAQSAVAFKDRATLWLHINGDASISITAPTSGYIGGGMVVAITQGTGGGHNFTFTGATSVDATAFDFTAMAVDDVAHVSLFYGADGTLFYSVFYHEVA